jgi:class 3 adenylate cyclase
MRGSTELINHVEPEVMVRLLNQYLGQMTDVLFHYEGTIDKFAGDAVLGFFGAPEGHADDPLRAVCAAAAMQRAFAGLLLDWRRRYPTLPGSLGIGIGIATGDVVVGNIGSAKRLEHTVIGPAVNLAARLSTTAPGTPWPARSASRRAPGRAARATCGPRASPRSSPSIVSTPPTSPPHCRMGHGLARMTLASSEGRLAGST